MRTLIWGGLALVAVAAVAFCLVVQHGSSESNSFLGQVGDAAGRLVIRSNPLVALGRRNAPATPACQYDKPCPSQVSQTTVEVAEPIVLEIFSGESLNTTTPLDLETPPLFQLPADSQSPEPDSVETGEESEFDPYEFNYPQSKTTEGSEPPVVDKPDALFGPGLGAAPAAEPCPFRCGTRCPNIDVDVQLPFCCVGLLQTLTRCLRTCLEGTKDSAVELTVVQPDQELTSDEQAEFLDFSELPEGHPATERLQEDPHYHHQYPGCPYTGHCPAPYHYRYVPYVPAARPNIATPVLPESLPQLPASEEAGDEDEEDLKKPSLDTLECRPSDLLPGNDFDEPI